MEGMTWGEHSFVYVSHGKTELAINLTHSDDFSIHALQEKIEDHDEFVEYTYAEDPLNDDPYMF